MKSFLIGVYVFLGAFTFPVLKDKKTHHFSRCQAKLSIIGELNPEFLPECSGICFTKNNTFLAHNDGGNRASLFELNTKGKILREIPILNTKNKDWEDITQDDAGNTYVGDFGNNNNARKDLIIYKLNSHFEKTADIKFHFPDQISFPPTKEKMNFDCEALFWFDDSLYFFSKNRGDKVVKMYRLPTQGGNYTAELRDSISLKGWITAADISPSKTEFTLLSYGQVYTFSIQNSKIDFSSPKEIRYFKKLAQSEAISYLNDSVRIITNEQGKIFKLK